MSDLPVTRPGKIIAVGLNYRDHASESEVAPPASPIMFAKWPTCLIVSRQAIRIPAEIDEVDWEPEGPSQVLAPSEVVKPVEVSWSDF